MRNFISVASIIIATNLCGQVAPGGVTASLRGWYDASAGIGLTSGAVSTWSDQSGNGFHGTQTVTADRPVPNTTGFNYNPTVTFDGFSENIGLPNLMASTATGLTMFTVARQTATNRDPNAVIMAGQASPTGAGGGYAIVAANAANNVYAFAVNNYTNNITFAANALVQPNLLTGNFNGSTAGSLQYFQNGTSAMTDAYAGQVGNGGGSFIGSATAGGNNCFYGDIAEVIVYNAGLSLANTQRVESYLALKYGVSKAGNYFNSSGTNIFTVTAPYNNEIIGIGRDDNSKLYQKQSKSYDDSIRIYINNNLAATNSANAATFSSNNQFLVIGHNNGRASGQLTEKPASVYSRLAREWKITNTGFSGAFNFDIRLNSISVPGSINGAHLRLLVDDDGDFSNATVYNLGINFANPWVEVNNISTSEIPINSTKYFTIGSTNSNSPLPIELFTFESLLCGDQVCVRWSTATEKNNERFEIERTSNGEEWTVVGTVPGAINSSVTKHYEFVDKQPLPAISYYRLKQIDLNGEFTYSNISSVDNSGTADLIKLFPNPANDEATISGAYGKIKVINAIGADVSHEVLAMPLSNGNIQLKTSSLLNGIYYLQIFRASSTPVKVFKLFIRH